MVILIWLFTVFSLVLGEYVSEYDYCETKLCKNITHIGCKNDGSLGFNCTLNAQVAVFNDELIDVIIDKMNTIRNRVARGGFNGYNPAKRMASMSWDDELSYLAGLNVRQCVQLSDGCRNTKRFKFVGQCLAYKGYSGDPPALPDVLKSIIDDLWYKEYKDLDVNTILSFKAPTPPQRYTNFATIIKENNNAIGCAALIEMASGYLKHYLTCNFASVPFIRNAVYATSNSAASGCLKGTNEFYSFLCARTEDYGEGLGISTGWVPKDERVNLQNETNPDYNYNYDSYEEETTKKPPKPPKPTKPTKPPKPPKPSKPPKPKTSKPTKSTVKPTKNPFQDLLDGIANSLDQFESVNLSVNVAGSSNHTKEFFNVSIPKKKKPSRRRSKKQRSNKKKRKSRRKMHKLIF